MRLFDELFKDAENALTRCTIVPNGGGYFEGVKAVGDFSPERIVVCFPKESVAAQGEELCIKKYCDGDLYVTGKIYALQVLGAPENSPEKR